MDSSIIKRFYSHVDKTGLCYEWTASCNTDGYGWFGLDSEHVYLAHRFAWIIYHGEDAGELKVLHHCDNPPCVRRGHLFLGTDKINGGDKARKNRAARHFGESNGLAKLTEIDVLLIRSLDEDLSQRQLADRFNVSQVLIGNILRREIWRHI